MISGGWRIDFPQHTAPALFAIAADIESYPSFLPWCRLARIKRRDGPRLVVDNLFGAGPFEARFQSQALLAPPHGLSITSDNGPFRRFRLEWRFEPLAQGGARVTADYEMKLRSPLLGSLARLSLPEMERRVIQAFKERVRKLEGGCPP